jgi:nucleoside phosphorylase
MTFSMKRQPSVSEIKRLFARCAGRCAFQGCLNNLILDAGGVIAEVAHICASSPEGPRFDPSQGEEQRHGIENLILLCPTHHALVDANPKEYGAVALREMKSRHESLIRDALTTPGNATSTLGDTAATQLARQVDPAVADVAIVAALPIELSAILCYFPTLQKVTIGDTSRTYYQGILVAGDGVTRYRVVATLLPSMGNLQAAVATSEVIKDWRPRYVVLCGIAGGLRSDLLQLGDVVVGTEVIYYELAKIRDDGIERRPVTYRADPLLIDRALHMQMMSAWRARLPSMPELGERGAEYPGVHFAPVASGDKVIASAADGTRLMSLHPKLAAVEMEAGGVATSAFAAAHRVGFFMVRGICDFADQNKGDEWHSFAAHSAASFLGNFLESRPIAPSEGGWAPERTSSAKNDPKWIRSVLFPRLCSTLNMEELRDLCFLLEIDVEDLEGSTKRAKIRELLLRAERRGRLEEIVSAYEQFIEEQR